MRLTLTTALIIITLSAFSQRATVYYDFAKNTFGNFEDLPAEEDLLINGALPPGTELVEVILYQDEVKPKDELYTGFWMANGTTGATEFSVPMNYPLNPGREYTFVLSFYTPVKAEARKELYQQTRKNLEAYLNLNYEIDPDDNELELKQSARKLRRELDQIVLQSMSQYRITSPGAFSGFSDIVLAQLKSLDGYQLSTANAQASPLTSLLSLIDGELRSILNQDIVMLRTQRELANYKVEDKPGYFFIVGGYGAMFYGGGGDNVSYDDNPFVGLGFPFATTKMAPKFLRNAAFSAGIFTKDFNVDGRTFTGPIVNKPVFVGLDYKLFSFVRFNAGAVLLEEVENDFGLAVDSGVKVRPFVGLSAKLNLSISLDK
ncbi:MAG: hypothetical protein AB8F78_10720 [Saprospiraceae bacterium]